MHEAEQRLTEEQETMLGLQVNNHKFQQITSFMWGFYSLFWGVCYFGGNWVKERLGVQVSVPPAHCHRPMCRHRSLQAAQAEAEVMMPVEDISNDSPMVDARIDIKVVRAAEGMEARFW